MHQVPISIGQPVCHGIPDKYILVYLTLMARISKMMEIMFEYGEAGVCFFDKTLVFNKNKPACYHMGWLASSKGN